MGIRLFPTSMHRTTRTSLLVALSFAWHAMPANAVDLDQPLSGYLQIGSRAVAGPAADYIEVRLIIPPDLRVYAGSKITLQIPQFPNAVVRYPEPSRFRMVDGSVHDVYAGAISVTAAIPRGAARCGRPIASVLTVQGCTASICFPPEAIPLPATVSSC